MTHTCDCSLDVRKLPPAERHQKIFSQFDALPEGGSFTLVNDHDPRPLYYQLKAERADVVRWESVTSAPGEWRISIGRVAPKESETRVGAYFERDHDEIDVLFGYLRLDVHVAAMDPRAPKAGLAPLFDEFNARLERHIRWEEEVLFPEVEKGSPMLAQGPGRVMRMEHEEIRRLKAAVGERLHRATIAPEDLRACDADLTALFEVLSGHNGKEESVYYPMSDEMFAPDVAADVLRRVRAIRGS